MTILVTGSAGHLGEALMRTLRIAGREARGLDIKPSPFTDHVGSIGDRAFVRSCLDGVCGVIHTATLHKPHIATHQRQEFVDTNISGTLAVLEEAAAAGVVSFVYTSTTSAFGGALAPALDGRATWVDEDVVPIPKNIYGVTKMAAEDVCFLIHRKHFLPIVVLRTSRFFPEADDDDAMRRTYEIANVQANELLYRRADIEDVVGAHLLALEKAPRLGFARYIISATTPFGPADLPLLNRDAAAVVRRLFPQCAELYARRSWTLFPSIDRVYVNRRARNELDWKPRYDFAHVLDSLCTGRDFRSPLSLTIGIKGYHDAEFGEAPYPVDR